MACKKQFGDLSPISYDCNTAFGGIQGVKISDKLKSRIVEIEFNNKDAFSNATEELTIAPEGTVGNTQTVQIEIPKLTKEHYEAIESFSDANMELIVYILTKAGRLVKFGEKFGAYVSVADADSGASRKEKNRIQITLTAEEDVLGDVVDDGATEYGNLTVSDAAMVMALSEEEEEPAPKVRRTKVIEVEE